MAMQRGITPSRRRSKLPRTRRYDTGKALEAAARRVADAEHRAALAERRLAEAERHAAQAQTAQRLQRLVDASIIGVVWTDLHGTDVQANDAFLNMVGYTREDLHEGRIPWGELTPPDHRDRDAKALRELLEHGRCAPFERDCLHRDGSRVPLLVSAALLDADTSNANPYWASFHMDTSAVRAAHERLRAANEELQAQQAANARAMQEVERLNVELREANAAKDQFLAILSHELRNPLSPILMGVQLLRNALPEGDSVRQTLGIIERNAQLEARLVGDLLDLSRVASGKLNLQRAPVALDAVVQAAVDGRLAEAEAAGLALRADVAAGLWVLADGDRLQQVLANLLSNAVKFTPSGGAIRVGVRESAGWAQITVEDTGDGIDPGLLDHLFELFRQGEVSGQRRSGLGIGLALVKSVIDLHGGRVRAESAGPGEGSRFTVELPLIAGPEAVSRPGGMAAPARILLVEDNPDTRAMLSQSLAALGHQVQTAASGEEALQILAEREAAGAARPPTLPLAPSSTRRAGTPGILLVDIGLPGMNGYEFLERARTLPGVGHVPAFAVTALRRQDDVRQAREAGYAGHFVKPVDVAALDRHIREWLAAVVSDQ